MPRFVIAFGFFADLAFNTRVNFAYHGTTPLLPCSARTPVGPSPSAVPAVQWAVGSPVLRQRSPPPAAAAAALCCDSCGENSAVEAASAAATAALLHRLTAPSEFPFSCVASSAEATASFYGFFFGFRSTPCRLPRSKKTHARRSLFSARGFGFRSTPWWASRFRGLFPRQSDRGRLPRRSKWPRKPNCLPSFFSILFIKPYTFLRWSPLGVGRTRWCRGQAATQGATSM